ncbi:response regulator [Halalkalirubrum salinum]|uniref:response regulator n=1 Tax=Halalkalirubrum salinum TaxID=2563889 RepID=UPI0010FB7F00|nr:response regulator [Halalkalirubrum salinum]
MPGRIRVLAIDDDEATLELLADTFDQLGGFTLTTVPTPSAGLNLLRVGRPIDCLVTDFRMPEMNGPAVRSEAKAIDPTLPVIMMSATERAELPPLGPVHAFVHKRGPQTYHRLAETVRVVATDCRQANQRGQLSTDETAIR